MPTTYPPLSIGAPARLALFKREAAEPHWVGPLTWRDVRFANLNSPADLSQGQNSNVQVWYSQSGAAEFRRERFCDDIIDMSHTGWFTDGEECSETARGIVARLPHGRFIAGYLMSMNDERVYFGDVYTDEREAARAADEHARIIGESESEYQARFQEADRLDNLIAGKKKDVCACKESLELAIAACKGATDHSVTWMRAMRKRKQARTNAHGIITDIRALMRERQGMGEF